MVFANPLYDEDIDVDQPILCPNVYKGALHGIVNLLFEEYMDEHGLHNSNLNDDEMSICSEKSDYSFSHDGSGLEVDIAFCVDTNELHDMDYVINKSTPCSGCSSDYFHVISNPLFGCEETLENLGLVLEIDIDKICEYKSNFSFECQPVTHKICKLKVCVTSFTKLNMKIFYLSLIAWMRSIMEKIPSLVLICMSILIHLFMVSMMLKLFPVCICTMKVKSLIKVCQMN